MTLSTLPRPECPPAAGTAGVDGAISTTGTAGTAGTTGADVRPKMSPEGLRELISGAKVGAPPPAAPAAKRAWETLDPAAAADRAMSLRTNGYERALLRYVAGLRGESVQQTIKALLREAAKTAAEK